MRFNFRIAISTGDVRSETYSDEVRIIMLEDTAKHE